MRAGSRGWGHGFTESVLAGWLQPVKDSDPLLPAGGAEERRNDAGPVLGSGLPTQSGEMKASIYPGSPTLSSPPHCHVGGIFEKHVMGAVRV